MVHGSGSVWVTGKDGAEEVSDWDSDRDTAFYVTSNPDPDPGTTDLTTLSVITENYDDIGCSDSNDFCDGADVNENGEMNDLDVSDLFYEGGSSISVEEDSFVYQTVIAPEEADAVVLASAPESLSFTILTNKASNISNL
jgi:hypothetical protein